MQAAEVTNALAIVGRVHDKSKVDRNLLIALISLADRRGRLVRFGLERGWTISISVAIGKMAIPIAYLCM
jgi:hypothetical protein